MLAPTMTAGSIEGPAAGYSLQDAAAVARRAVYGLASLIADLGDDDRASVLALLRDEILTLPATA
jgi:hypothetical protein